MNISDKSGAAATNKTCNTTDLEQFYSFTYYDILLQSICVLFGFLIHSYILWLIIKGREKGIASEFFTLNISVCEIVFYLRSLNSAFVNTFPSLWKVRMFLSGFVATARFFQCLMCVERYLAVVHPVSFLKYKHLRYKVACSVITWILIIIFCVVSLELTNQCFFRVFKSIYLLQYIIFLSINMFCCLAVLRALKKPGPGDRGKEREEENHMKKRAFYLILITTITLILTYVPSSITALQHVLSFPASRELESLSLTCFFLPGFVQPLLFIHRVGKLPFCKPR